MAHQTFGTRTATAGIDRTAVCALADEHLDWRFKALPPEAWGRTTRAYLASSPHLSDLGTPLLTLDAGALDHNLRTMAAWCHEAGVGLAPHGKTTMAPALWQAQLDAGAVGITLANLPQLHVARAFGVQRLMLANALVDPAGLAWVAGELAADPDFAFVSWADSVRTVTLMDEALQAAGVGRGSDPETDRPIEVVVELGGEGGRTGARSIAEAEDIAKAVHAAPTLRLAGVAGYEGSLAHDTAPESLDTVRAYLRDLADLHRRLAPAYETEHSIVTAGGSAYFDLVAEVLVPAVSESAAEVVVRAGAYVIHDDGYYRGVSPLARTATDTDSGRFRSAMHGWARVVSHPEPQLWLLDAGKRDLPFDEGLPVPQLVRGTGPTPGTEPARGVVTAMNDQHTFLRDAATSAPIGAVIRLGLSHPCTALDKWTLIPVLDDADSADPKVVDLVRTFF
ncbi:alanine racemase [Catenulispora sp. NF23]|uniref:alanine racemase n=1 Tax=Catenulispora pinistramenti TaxID=2705254 RepID=UPI001BADEDEC|nr:alanine racemase [Catenulispora pinistramenti]MBS2533402.1 alanine racemase [Catenulispora pinistramenti]